MCTPTPVNHCWLFPEGVNSSVPPDAKWLAKRASVARESQKSGSYWQLETGLVWAGVSQSGKWSWAPILSQIHNCESPPELGVNPSAATS